MTTLPPEYFENRAEQNKIAAAVLKAIPENVYYHNLIIVFADMLLRFTQREFKSDIFSKSTAHAYKEKQAKCDE